MSRPEKSKPLTRASRRYRPSYLANAAVNPRDRPGSRRRLPPGLPVWLTLPHRAERDSHPLSCQCIADGSCTDLRDRLTSIRTIHGPLPPFKRLWPGYRWTVGPCDLSPTKVSHPPGLESRSRCLKVRTLRYGHIGLFGPPEGGSQYYRLICSKTVVLC